MNFFFEAEKKSIFFPKYGYPENNVFYSGPITPEKDDTWLLTLMMVIRFQNGKIHGYFLHIFQNRSTVYCQNPHFFRFLGLLFVVKYQSPLKIPLFEHQNLKIQYSDKIHLRGQIISFSESIHMLGFFRVPANLLDHYGNMPKL